MKMITHDMALYTVLLGAAGFVIWLIILSVVVDKLAKRIEESENKK